MIKRIFIGLLLILLLLGGAAFWLYQSFTKDNVALSENYELLIPHGWSYEQLMVHLKDENLLLDPVSFRRLSKLMKYDRDEIPSGRYIISPTMSSRKIISKLRGKFQDPVRVTFSQARFLSEIAGQAANKLDADSIEILQAFLNEVNLEKLKLTEESAISQIIPNTYEVFWDVTPQAFVERMQKEYNRFWAANNRIELAQKLEMTPTEVSTIASIVEKESIQNNEKPTIAGVYLNRLRIDMPLQADPTVVFAMRDFEIRRVLNKHLEFDSPYNTYKYRGVPPGPICMPSIASIDAVLQAESHDYIYFCAKPGYNGEHLFAANSADHGRNARVLHAWLNKEGIY